MLMGCLCLSLAVTNLWYLVRWGVGDRNMVVGCWNERGGAGRALAGGGGSQVVGRGEECRWG